MGDSGQLTSSAAEAYDELFLPALFGAWLPKVVAAAQLAPGMRVVDVACPGALPLEAARAVTPGGAAVTVRFEHPALVATARKR